MFKKEISFISDLNLNKLQVLGERLTIKDINQSKLHPALIKYINSAIDKEIFLDKKKLEVNTVFDYSGDRINNYFSLISEEMKRTQNFDLKFIKQILQNAIVFNANYLSKPNRTLINFVFGQHEVKEIDEIIINVSHAYYYRYLQKIIFTYFEKKKTILMRRDEFASLLSRIDQISKETHLEDTLITAINSMANFFDTNPRGSEKLPLPAIKFYLQEKRLPEFITKLEEKLGIDNNSLVLVSDVASIFLSVTPESEILVEQTKLVEDELVEYTSANSSVSEEIFEQNNIQEIQEVKEEITEIENSEPTELVDDETEIPNEDILIEEDRNGGKFIESENAEEEIETDQNDHNNEEEKKKPEVKTLLRKLINLDKLYNSFIKFPKPFTDNKQEELELSNISSMISRATKYQIDLSTLAEEIENPRGTIKETVDSYYMPPDIIEDEKEINKVSLDRELTEEEIISEENSDESIPEIKDINESIDEIVADDSSVKEFKEEIVDIEIVDVDNDETQSMENLIDENSLTLNEEDGEEVTEVFSDLTYLDQKEVAEIDLEMTDEENVQEKAEEVQPSINNLESEDEVEQNKKFSEVLASKDMTRIIESIFDYDMEDYHSMINGISGAANEAQAIELAEEYFRNNHIEMTSNEVLEFRSLISEYFTKAYS